MRGRAQRAKLIDGIIGESGGNDALTVGEEEDK